MKAKRDDRGSRGRDGGGIPRVGCEGHGGGEEGRKERARVGGCRGKRHFPPKVSMVQILA